MCGVSTYSARSHACVNTIVNIWACWQLTADSWGRHKAQHFYCSWHGSCWAVCSAVVGGNNITIQLTWHLKIRVKPYLMYHHPELSWSLLVPVKLCKVRDLGYRWVGHILAQLFSVWLQSYPHLRQTPAHLHFGYVLSFGTTSFVSRQKISFANEIWTINHIF